MLRPACLWFVRYTPYPLNSGDVIYSARLAEALASADCDVVGVAMQRPGYDLGSVPNGPVNWTLVEGSPRGYLHALTSPLPIEGARIATAAFRRKFDELLDARDWDAIMLDHYSMSWAADRIAQRGDVKGVTLHLAHDFETDVLAQIAVDYQGDPLRKLVLRENARRAAKAERRLAQVCDIVTAITEQDAAEFSRIGARETLVSPPGYDGPRRASRKITADTPRRVVLLGSFNWIAKQMNLRLLVEAVDQRFAEAGVELHVIGALPDALRAELSAKSRAVRFHGFVDDIGPILDQSRLGLIAETTGGGFKIKALDYIFMRVPILAIHDAVRGLPPQLDSRLARADDVHALGDLAVRLIDDLPALNAMQNGAYREASGAFDWSDRGAAMREAILRRRAGRAA